MRNTLLFLLLCLLPFGVYAQHDYSFKHVNNDVGLSSNNVKAIYKDSNGFIWLGTKNGLNRYDGHNLKRLNCYDADLESGNNNIGALCEDNNQNLWVGTDRGVYKLDLRTDKFHAIKTKTREGVTPYNWVQDIVKDEAGNMWALLPDQGVFRFQGDSMDYYAVTDKAQFKEQSPGTICIDRYGQVWVGTNMVGLFRYDPNRNEFLPVNTRYSFQGKRLSCICSREESLFLGTENGELYVYHVLTGDMERLPFEATNKVFLRDMQCVGNELWIGTHSGLYIYNVDEREVTHLSEDPLRPFGLSDNVIYCIYADSKEGVWLGTMFGGADYHPNTQFTFSKYVPSSTGGLSSKLIRGLGQDSHGEIWVGTEDKGLNRLNPQTGVVEPIGYIPSPHNIVLNVYCYGDRVYVGNMRYGMDVVSHGKSYPYLDNECSDNSVYSYLIDSSGNEWIGFGWGLYCKDAKGHMRHVTETGYDWIFDIFEASDGTIWFATMGNGIWKYTPATNEFKGYIYTEKDNNGMRSNSISSIMEDRNGRVWFSTDRGGISCYNKESDDFTTIGVKEGLPDDVAYDILEDKQGNLWFGTNNGLVKYHPDTRAIKVFTTKDGLLGNQFNYKSALKADNGYFYFGGIEGLIAFNPEDDVVAQEDIPIYITRLNIFNREMKVGDPDSPLSENIEFTDKLELPYDKSNFSLSFAALDYSSPMRYSNRMEPIDKEWIAVEGGSNLSYANLSPGTYVLHVRAEGNGTTSERTLLIKILPPWYRSAWAYLCYVLLIIGVIMGWFLWYRNHKEGQFKRRQDLFEVIKEKELVESKVKFFTEIAHEIRTPLTLIDAPLEAVEEIGVSDARVNKHFKVMRQNTKRLLDLTGQLLDFQKIESQQLTLKYENTDINVLLNETIDRFEPTIQLKHKELIRNIKDEHIQAVVDKEAITKIFSNLLNNALKYARLTIIVSLESDGKDFFVRVISDGAKIAQENVSKIFEPFYQMSNRTERSGVGIGLPLSRSLAELHKGSLYLENMEEQTNTFVLQIPLNREAVFANETLPVVDESYIVVDESNQSKEPVGYTVLLAEDNEPMRLFIAEQLRQSFIVEEAKDGKEALECLRDSRIDLIVTDISMPEMNGFELCRAVKDDINLSHIPVIFLTAHNDIENKIAGLQSGAEAYIEKPFSMKYLSQQIQSLLDNRRRAREAFSKRPFFKVDDMKVNKADEEFMNSVIKSIQEHIDDENFNVETMADIFCMSRSNLLRKIKTVFNLSPVELIRVIKLKKAAEYIQEGKYRIGDVCYMVGINSPSYFSKLFFRQFGITPKDFEKQCKKSSQSSLSVEDIPLSDNGEKNNE